MDGVAVTAATRSIPRRRARVEIANAFFVRHATAVAIMALTILVIWAAYIFHEEVGTTEINHAWVVHTYETRAHLRALLLRVEDAVIGERSFLMGGREDYLGAYNEAVRPGENDSGAHPLNSITQEMQILKEMLSDNPEQVQRLDAAGVTIQQLLDHLAAMIVLRRNEGAAALPKIDPAHGEEMLNSIRTQFIAMIEEEGRLLDVREKRDALSIQRYNLSVFAAIVAFYIVVVFAIRLCQKAEKIAQAALHENEKRYSLAVQGLSVGLWDWNVMTGEVYWSPRFREILGITDKNFATDLNYVETQIHPDDREAIMGQLHGHVQSKGKIAYDNECRVRRTDGAYVWLHSRGQAIWDKAGNPVRMVGSVEDITARKEIEEQIQQHVRALQRSNQELDDFAYIASHDLKEPLRGLTNNAMFLKEDLAGKLDGDTGKRLDRMTYLCQRLERLVDDLLYFSRLGRQDLAIQSTDLNEVIKDIQLTMETTLRDANAVIDVPETLPKIVCDLPRVTEVFRNLIVNAVKYNKNAEKHVEIGCADPKLTAGNDNIGRAFYVRDNGIGIPAQFHTDIFRIFKRLNEEDDSIKGTGVGLTFVRKIIERHGGKIWLESEVGKGTTFYFTINTRKEAAS